MDSPQAPTTATLAATDDMSLSGGPAAIEPTALPDAALDTTVQPLSQLTDLLLIGGPVVWILLALSSVALAIVLLKSWQFHTMGLSRTNRTAQALGLWRSGQQQAAVDALANARQPLPQLLHMAMGTMRQGSQAINTELLREELSRRAVGYLEQLRSHLRALEVIAALSPLLGLFGTVLGMIAAFRQMELAGSQVDPSVLSGGIWVALLTTAVGLAVAIPTVMAHSWLERRVERFRHRIEDGLTQIFTHPVEVEEHAAGRLLQFEKRHAPA